MNFFYCNELTGSPVVFLNSDESYHCFKVLRLRNGETILVTDGKGKAAHALIKNSHPEKTELLITGFIQLKSDPLYRLHVGISPLKNPDRLEWFAEKATELGVNEITPVICSRTEKKSVNLQRLQKTVLAAMKQSMRCILPVVHPPAEIKNFISNQPSNAVKLICSQQSTTSIYSMVKQEIITALIGPEGDFTHDEIETAKAAGFEAVTLGETRLRTETAGIYICAAVKTLLTAP